MVKTTARPTWTKPMPEHQRIELLTKAVEWMRAARLDLKSFGVKTDLNDQVCDAMNNALISMYSAGVPMPTAEIDIG